MTITRRSFELGISISTEVSMKAAYSILRDNPEEAYSHSELCKSFKSELLSLLRKVGGQSLRLRLGALMSGSQLLATALTKLEEVGAISSRKIDETVYYAYKGPLEDSLSARVVT